MSDNLRDLGKGKEMSIYQILWFLFISFWLVPLFLVPSFPVACVKEDMILLIKSDSKKIGGK